MYNKIIELIDELINKNYKKIINNVNIDIDMSEIQKIIIRRGMKNTHPSHTNLTETIYDNKQSNCPGTEELKDDSLLTKKGEPDLNNLFTEEDYKEILITDKPGIFVAPNPNAMDQLRKKLLNFEEIPENEKELAISRVLSLENIINSRYDEIWEARKIMNWLKEKLDNDKYYKNLGGSPLKIFHYKGYVYIIREGIDIQDKIRKELVPNLKFLAWQYGYPIDYNTLKYILFQNSFQKSLFRDKDILKEAMDILSQEYLIALQPEPKYQMWTVKRLILCWYADTVLQDNIRKIKVLVNQWRAKGDENYNKKHGILPSIVIYPRYGFRAARVVMKKIGEYFFFYRNLAWICSQPSYFIQIDKLMYYTNGLLDLKLYFRNVIRHSKGSVKNDDIFNPKYTKFKYAPDFFKI